jgi:hypothetical protein
MGYTSFRYFNYCFTLPFVKELKEKKMAGERGGVLENLKGWILFIYINIFIY